MHFLKFFTPHSILLRTPPHFSKMWESSLSAKFLLPFFISLFMSQLSIKHITTHSRWSTVYHSIQFSLNNIWWDHQLFYFLQGCCDFPGRSFCYHPSTLSKSRKISTHLLIPPHPTIKHKSVVRLNFIQFHAVIVHFLLKIKHHILLCCSIDLEQGVISRGRLRGRSPFL